LEKYGKIVQENKKIVRGIKNGKKCTKKKVGAKKILRKKIRENSKNKYGKRSTGKKLRE
jgi:hypothetical protein